jgi:hypothetical protein
MDTDWRSADPAATPGNRNMSFTAEYKTLRGISRCTVDGGEHHHPSWSGARLHIPGTSHFELVGDRIIREFALVDELATWSAIALAAGWQWNQLPCCCVIWR